ncbi:radical SAM-linked protein [Elusimicrobium simillimum]|uniref:TIGR03936 family radical SAM-associated protein n=1 Tax=Elusimicrobium simillimum TaxID=3143438 RepID=UPI003C6F2172
MLKIYKMRIRYARANSLTQGQTANIWREMLLSSGLPIAKMDSDASRPRLTFGPPLALGQDSECEYIDLYFTDFVKDTEAFEALKKAEKGGIKVLESKEIPYQFPSIASLSDVVEYEVIGVDNFNPPPLEDFLGSKEIIVTTVHENGLRETVDIKPYILSAKLDGGVLKITLCKVNGRSVKVELFLAKWLNLGGNGQCNSFESSAVKIIKKNLYYSNSLGGYTLV